MAERNDESTEWIFCRNIKGKCSGLSSQTKVIEKIPKVINVHGEEVRGWVVKIIQGKTEGHVNMNLTNFSDE
jgi:hypothetical protein